MQAWKSTISDFSAQILEQQKHTTNETNPYFIPATPNLGWKKVSTSRASRCCKKNTCVSMFARR
jgi:hypothetical protein